LLPYAQSSQIEYGYNKNSEPKITDNIQYTDDLDQIRKIGPIYLAREREFMLTTQ